ncbi:DUF916 and DUF3324 domain-containing protein [Enterococcus faecium]|uniref:DUF916 and DUF3324 domain-containing protein n=1 Tax=Enterococcus faecium TaxID=1352 RepID=UPI0025B15B63|nr:DUF916 and DUF3324 domain-containing protein [Enterococcus faecium]MDN3079847.1 DUF916 and DUF3324 domain-containing protein [Enterococcus faecium]MDQ8230704.1 DUF916 and DUF3324 domain-containing protein [Enterococcus faecium]MDQ8233362.1 DUF916 and DUF3324 domain-containing protein [Enterococcus faecium]MDQ8240708.1 DUF916 and DUF3324 domain-containing protein [Enterococcus faecium]MDQ8253164.1 DUF916 and DUF3324 domain-containing protein [Enterococcus faecium]
MLKKNCILINCLLLTFVLSLCIFKKEVLADENKDNYIVEAILPDNQQKDTQDYFDLLVSPNHKQDLKVKISNKSNSKQKFTTTFNTATTNENGVIDYSDSNFKRDSSMEVDISKYVKLKESTIELDPYQEKFVYLELNMPSKEFSGTLLGGINIVPIKEKQVNGITQVFSKTIALKIRENTDNVKEKIFDGNIKLGQINYHNVVKMLIRNVSPTIITDVKANCNVRSVDSNNINISKNFSDISMAPNSCFYLPVEFNKQLSPGRYCYEIHLIGKNNKWHFSKEFEIKPEESRKLNNTAIADYNEEFNSYYILCILLFLLIIVVVYLYRRL